jgi:hypothetical protein
MKADPGNQAEMPRRRLAEGEFLGASFRNDDTPKLYLQIWMCAKPFDALFVLRPQAVVKNFFASSGSN